MSSVLIMKIPTTNFMINIDINIKCYSVSSQQVLHTAQHSLIMFSMLSLNVREIKPMPWCKLRMGGKSRTENKMVLQYSSYFCTSTKNLCSKIE